MNKIFIWNYIQIYEWELGLSISLLPTETRTSRWKDDDDFDRFSASALVLKRNIKKNMTKEANSPNHNCALA